ncbi:hypothetical protein SI859A1_00966 [Aurantimonas manganoxydans SI85-9A1]|uniref:Uncharacterized protein n=1 Tax=Aurantimonas manganoxydans (strain ATCC BAA-1229 / DSM 21871 / SI85-9A1) TaxID=287752 RepID=Q1YJN2_AURMS|nr:hypothetical protein SI859A1_00966 [Aurantimonas manganoxydans SI85-9A1]
MAVSPPLWPCRYLHAGLMLTLAAERPRRCRPAGCGGDRGTCRGRANTAPGDGWRAVARWRRGCAVDAMVDRQGDTRRPARRSGAQTRRRSRGDHVSLPPCGCPACAALFSTRKIFHLLTRLSSDVAAAFSMRGARSQGPRCPRLVLPTRMRANAADMWAAYLKRGMRRRPAGGTMGPMRTSVCATGGARSCIRRKRAPRF